ncbi:MAG: arsenic efflux protein, partial [Clostridiales bacterium]|nr:arsenic efflux protein [Clostridiales bacterium]
MWWEVILDALKDTAILFPFLFLMYILIEAMEHNTKVGKPNRALSGKLAPLIGSATGIVPMCGFSVMAAKLYRHRHITLGTLFAVFLASSDEALLVLIASPALGWLEKAIVIPVLIASKFVIGVVAGYLIDLLFIKRQPPVSLVEEEAHEHEHEHEEDHEHDEHYT